MGDRVGDAARVDIDEFGPHALRTFGHVNGRGAGEARVVNVGHHQQLWPPRAVQGIVNVPQAHRPRAGEDGHVAAVLRAQVMLVAAENLVEIPVVRADDGAHRLGEGGLEEGIAAVRQKAIHLHDLVRHDAIRGVAAAEAVGVTGRVLRALVVERGLDSEFLPRLEFVRPVCAHLFNHAGELVSDERRVLRRVIWDALVVGARLGGLVGGHADAVRNDATENLAVADLRQVESFQA